MPSRGSDKCRQCSKLSLEQALQKHGAEGDGCWSGEPCHKRRTYYRHRDRYNRDRRLKYMGDKHSSALLYQIGLKLHRIEELRYHFQPIMPRVLKLEISETADYLEKSLKQAASGTQKERLLMLWWLKTGQVSQHQELGQRLSRDASTITRWLQKYRRGGLTQLLEVKTAPGRVALISGAAREQLQQRLSEPEGFHSYGEIVQWLRREFGMSLKYKTVHQTVRYRLRAKLKVPRPTSIEQNPLAVETFKKTLSTLS
jgi:transposase